VTTATKRAGTARPDRRYKDPQQAPSIVSEKRLTFFLPEETYRALRKQTGLFQVANAEAREPDVELPETPSALVREAIEYWLDQFRESTERIRSEKNWEDRLKALQAALKRAR